MTLKKRTFIVAVWVLSMLGVAIWARAQSFSPVVPVTPTVIADGDLGFRVVGMRGRTPVGTLLVKINGEWVEAAFGSSPNFQLR